MTTEGAGKPRCSETGLTVPECSCRGCLERMLSEVQPALLAEQILVTRVTEDEPGSAGRREAA